MSNNEPMPARGRVPGGFSAVLVLLLLATGTLVVRERGLRARLDHDTYVASTISQFLGGQLLGPTPDVEHDRTLADALDDAARELDRGRFAEEPFVEAGIRTTLARAYLGVGKIDAAIQQASTAEGIERQLRGDNAPAALAARLVHARAQVASGAEGAADLLRTMHTECTERLGSNHRTTVEATLALADVEAAHGEHDAAINLLRAIVHLHDAAAGRLARLLRATGAGDNALTILNDQLATHRIHNTLSHPRALGLLDERAFLLVEQGDIDEAVATRDQALQLRLEALGDADPRTLRSRSALSDALLLQGELDTALGHAQIVVSLAQHTLTPADIGYYLARQGVCQAALGQYAAAEESLTRGHTMIEGALGPRDERTRTAVMAMIEMYDAAGNDEQREIWKRVLKATGRAYRR